MARESKSKDTHEFSKALSSMRNEMKKLKTKEESVPEVEVCGRNFFVFPRMNKDFFAGSAQN